MPIFEKYRSPTPPKQNFKESDCLPKKQTTAATTTVSTEYGRTYFKFIILVELHLWNKSGGSWKETVKNREKIESPAYIIRDHNKGSEEQPEVWKKNQISKIKAWEKSLPRLKGKDKEIKIKKEKLNDNAGRHKIDIMHYRTSETRVDREKELSKEKLKTLLHWEKALKIYNPFTSL